jgi:hypothetical protein
MRASLLSIALTSLLLGAASPLRALDPLPDVQEGPGYSTWTIEADKPLLQLETVLHDLRFDDRMNYEKALEALGIGKQDAGRGNRVYPELVQPIEATAQFLGFERRKMAVLSAPVKGKHEWYAVVLRQEGNGEKYWRARQVFKFDTDPVEGFHQSFPDVNGEDIHFWMVRHLSKEGIDGRSRVDSLYRWDERGRLRLTFQELADAFHPARFQGEAIRLQQELSFKGDQVIHRTLHIRTYPWMKREEWEKYRSVDAPTAPAAKVITVKEDFAWDPADFNFYGAEQELTKLVTNKSPQIRREAARRLGEHLKSTHPQLEAAMLKDKDAYVRMQAALALGAIGDPKALPSVEKALQNWDEPDTMREAYEQAEAQLKAAAAKQGTADAQGEAPQAAPAAPHKKRKRKPAKEPMASSVGGEIPKPEDPKINAAK